MSDQNSQAELKAHIDSLTTLVQQVLSGVQKNDHNQSILLAISAKQDAIITSLANSDRVNTGLASLVSEMMNKLDSIESSILSIQPTETKDGLA